MRVGNFYLLKYSRALSKKELKELREGFPEALTKDLGRASIPMLRVGSLAEDWSIHYAYTHTVFKYIDEVVGDDGEMDAQTETGLYHLLLMFFADTTIVPDQEYFEGKRALFEQMLKRRSADLSEPLPEEENERLLDAAEEAWRTKDNLMDIVKMVKENEGVD